VEHAFRAEGCSAPAAWGNTPGDTYGWHTHQYHKVLFCQEGSITFHTVGPAGCACVEATRA